MPVLQVDLEADLSSSQAVHKELDQRFADLQQQHQSDAAAATSRQATLQSELQQLTEVHVSVLNQLSDATAEVNELGDLAQDHSQLTAEFANLQSAHERLQASKEAVDAEHALLQARVDLLHQALADSEAAAAELSSKLTALQGEYHAVSQGLADSEAANSELSSKLTKLQSESASSIADLEAELEDVTWQRLDAQQSKQQLGEELSVAQAQLQQLADAKQVCRPRVSCLANCQ